MQSNLHCLQSEVIITRHDTRQKYNKNQCEKKMLVKEIQRLRQIYKYAQQPSGDKHADEIVPPTITISEPSTLNDVPNSGTKAFSKDPKDGRVLNASESSDITVIDSISGTIIAANDREDVIQSSFSAFNITLDIEAEPMDESSHIQSLPPKNPSNKNNDSKSNSSRDRSRSSSTESNNVRSSSPSSFIAFTTEDSSHLTGPMSDPISAVQGWMQNRNIQFQTPSLSTISSVFQKLGSGAGGASKDNTNNNSEKSSHHVTSSSPIITLDDKDTKVDVHESPEAKDCIPVNSKPCADASNSPDSNNISKNSFTPMRCLRCCGTVEGPKYSTCVCSEPTIAHQDTTLSIDDKGNRLRTASLSAIPMFGVGYSLFSKARTTSCDVSDLALKAVSNSSIDIQSAKVPTNDSTKVLE